MVMMAMTSPLPNVKVPGTPPIVHRNRQRSENGGLTINV
jgi:hypothetical protein